MNNNIVNYYLILPKVDMLLFIINLKYSEMTYNYEKNREGFSSFKLLLQRASTFTHLIFYNRKLICNYLLGYHGFISSTSRDGLEQAKCVDCGISFLLDPILQQAAMEIKESFSQVIRDHEQACQFYRIGMNYQEKQVTIALKKKVIEFGASLFYDIFRENCRFKEKLDGITKIETSFQQMLIKQKQKAIFNRLIQNQRSYVSQYVLALLGWKIKNNLTNASLACQYCGQQQRNIQSFDPVQSHHSYCLLMKQSTYLTILQLLFLESLNQLQCQFVKSQPQALAKKLRLELEQINKGVEKNMKQFIYRIKQIKASVIQTMDQEQICENLKQRRPRTNQLQNLANIEKLVQQMQLCAKKAIKKVKID